MKLASRGLRDLDRGEEAVIDSVEETQIRRQARDVYVKSFVSATILTAIALLK